MQGMTDAAHPDRSLDELGTPESIRAHREPHAERAPADPAVVDPHGATDAISAEEYVGRRGGIRGLWDSLAYGVQLAALSVYGPAPQSASADPVERLKRKYGRTSRRL